VTLGTLVISLDFELLWGVRDHATRERYGANILGGRAAIPKMLELFAQHEIRATWATVGFLFAETRDELLASLPPVDLRPRYRDPRLSNYSYLGELGNDEGRDPYYFGASLLRLIRETPGQEIGTHTLSHFYALEPGATLSAFEADLQAARSLAKRRGIELRSIVFPRNQYAAEHLDICRRQGIGIFRGNSASWAYRAVSGAGQTLVRRGLRLVDAHTGVLGPHLHRVTPADDRRPADVPASQFLRPCSGRLAAFHPLHLAILKRAMTQAARQGKVFHLWWHPHNFGRDLEANLSGLLQLLRHVVRLRDSHGMQMSSMAEQA